MTQRIGIFDWGAGGFGVYHKLKKASPETAILYFSDAGYTPYGKVPYDKLKERVRQVLNYMYDQGVAQILVACNAASIVLPVETKAAYLHILDAGIRLAGMPTGRCLAVLGGELTIQSGIHAEQLKWYYGKVRPVVAQPLSALIEADQIESVQFDDTLRTILSQVPEASHLLMACTHYPAAADKIQGLRPEIELLDPADELVRLAADGWSLSTTETSDLFLTTADLETLPDLKIPGFETLPERFEKIVV